MRFNYVAQDNLEFMVLPSPPYLRKGTVDNHQRLPKRKTHMSTNKSKGKKGAAESFNNLLHRAVSQDVFALPPAGSTSSWNAFP